MDAHTKDYIDSKVEVVKAQNDARFVEVLAGINSVGERVSHLREPTTWQQLALTMGSVGLVLLGVVFAVLGYASDRFDGGLSASSVKDELAVEQLKRDATQDARLDKILSKLDAMTVTPKP